MTYTQGFEFIANHPALDLVNTVENRLRREPECDLILEVEDFFRWLAAADLLTDREIAVLREQCESREEECQEALKEVKRLREAFLGLFGAIVDEEAPPADALYELNRILSIGARVRKVRTDRNYGLISEFVKSTDPLMVPVVMLAEAGADLLDAGEVSRIRMCDGHDCGDLFHDTSKSGRRRWCDMSKCGNRAKVGRYHNRRKR